MSFNTAITGLKAASTMLDVTGNNIANVSTTGFKSSRTQFSDIYSTAVVGAGSSNTPGSGVIVSGISQDFSAGTIEFTNNNLDLAINGSGFFQLNDGQGGISYTRAGAFELSKDGTIISANGKFLQGYGLDAQGNRLPIGNLAVTQKESPPSATSTIDLSFNIDARADASRLAPEYNRDDPSSFTYTTTVRTFDSLGNEQNIKFNFAEQRPVREVFTFDVTGLNSVTISGVEITLDPAATPPVGVGTELEDLARADRRIDPASFQIIDGELYFEFKAFATNLGDAVVQNTVTEETLRRTNLPTALGDPVDEKYRSASEVRTYIIPSGSFPISVAGVSFNLDGVSEEANAQAIVSRQSQILDRNPAIESVSVDDGQLVITFKATEGDIPEGLDASGNSRDPYPILISGNPLPPELTVQGDNSFQGEYRMYAYLNGTELLDIGKRIDLGLPGSATGGTQPGPILLSFSPNSGLLQGINGRTFPPGGAVPIVRINGADPADDSTVIQLDLTNTTQFASASIVKNQQQNGYTKGDLIGVTFAPTGEMIASFSNGQNQSLGVVAFATFENQDGLQPSGDTEWIATLASGNAILNPPGTGLNGTLRSAALEQSNVDLSAELVNLIQAQRNFQASSKTLETANNITQTILNI